MKAEPFQDPSAQMKRALFHSLVIGAVAVVLYMFCVKQWQTDLQEARKKYVDRQNDRNQKINDLKGAGQVGERLNAVTNECQAYLDGLLEPSLGSYATSARSLLMPLATNDLGLVINIDPTIMPPRRLPLPTPPSPQLYARQPIRLTCTGSYQAIASFILRVEEKMPLVALESFSFKAQKDPDNQLATLVLEWPIKGEKIPPSPQQGGR